MLLFSLPLRTQMAQDIITLLGGAPSIVFYTGIMPGSCEVIVTDTIVGSIILPIPFFNNVNGQDSLITSVSGIALSTNIVGYFRFYNNDAVYASTQAGVCVLQGTVGYSYQKIWQNNTSYNAGDVAVNGNQVFLCTVSGISSVAGLGPIEQINGVEDGSVYWNYLGPTGDLSFNSPFFQTGQVITLNTFQINIGNAPLI